MKIDLSKKPKQIYDWTIERHIDNGKIKWNPNNFELFVSEKQKDSIRCTDLLKELEGRNVANANLLDYLLDNPNLIPEEWKGKAIFFWGTIYCDRTGNLYVRYLCWDGGRWDWSDARWLGNDWNANDSALLLASTSNFDTKPYVLSPSTLEKLSKIEELIKEIRNE